LKNILLLDGQPNSGNTKLSKDLDQLVTLLQHKYTVKYTKLWEQKVKYCIGCWSCWVKTPGKCFVSDDSLEICHDFIHSDLVVFASPVIMGFTSALLKKTQDKLIPLLHPYIEIVQNECHHRKRYQSYPKLGLLVDDGGDDEDLKIITDIYKRFALNFKSELFFTEVLTDNTDEVFHAIDSI
jgi:multimeric flavodoxin WrbA